MRRPGFLVLLLVLASMCTIEAKPYGKLLKTHSFESCHYYDIVIMDDQGTASPKDDVVLAKGIIRDCKNEACLFYQDIEIISMFALADSNCQVYDFRIHFKKGLSLRGLAQSPNCED